MTQAELQDAIVASWRPAGIEKAPNAARLVELVASRGVTFEALLAVVDSPLTRTWADLQDGLLDLIAKAADEGGAE